MTGFHSLIFRLFATFIHHGSLEVRLRGQKSMRATGKHKGPHIIISLPNYNLLYRFLINAELAIPEAYMDGDLRLINSSLDDFLTFLLRNKQHYKKSRLQRLIYSVRGIIIWFKGRIKKGKAKSNVAHHYDLTDSLYHSFLDERRQYSCAYFRDGDDLEQAQRRKIARLAAKLCLKSNGDVLDIGCGWGELAYALYSIDESLHIKGITLSENQFGYAQKMAQKRQAESHLEFALQDYRDEDGRYDHIISVGMLEHVGFHSYQAYFNLVDNCLKDDGIAVIHTIGKQSAHYSGSPFIEKYIFPGGYLPTIGELGHAIAKTDLHILDIEAMHNHYADTLRHWRMRFIEKKAEMIALYDERFFRMWCFYLAGCEYYFRLDEGVVYQIQLSKKRGNSPSNRDYIARFEKLYLDKLCNQHSHSGKQKHLTK